MIFNSVSLVPLAEDSSYWDFSIPYEDLTFSDVYPSLPTVNVMGVGVPNKIEFVSEYVNKAGLISSPATYPANGSFADLFNVKYGSFSLPIIAYKMIMYNGDYSIDFEYCYYALGSGDFQLYKLTLSDVNLLISEGVNPPFQNDSLPSDHNPIAESLYWLYDIGSLLIHGTLLTQLLSKSMFGYNFVSIVFTSLFMVYAGFVLVKFLIK